MLEVESSVLNLSLGVVIMDFLLLKMWQLRIGCDRLQPRLVARAGDLPFCTNLKATLWCWLALAIMLALGAKEAVLGLFVSIAG